MKKIILTTILLGFLISCKKNKDIEVIQPDFIKTSLSGTLSVDAWEEFELFIPDNEEGVLYFWTVPDMLGILEGQGTNRIKVISTIDDGVIPIKSIGVTAERRGEKSYTRWLYKELTVLAPPPTLDNYRTKRYGSKTWMIENLKESGKNGDLGVVYNNDLSKEELYGRHYTWHEAMTGIPKATAADNPYVWGASGIDDAGNPYVLDGTYANSYNIQIQGACPEGWHVANMNDWYDLLAAIKEEYKVPGNALSDVANTKDGYILAWGRETGVVNAMNLTNWGIVGPYLKGSSPTSSGGLWQGGSTFNYGGNAVFPGGAYPLYREQSNEIEFNILPGGRININNISEHEGLYSYHWVAYRGTANPNNPLRLTVGSGNANFSNANANPLDALCLRCVANY